MRVSLGANVSVCPEGKTVCAGGKESQFFLVYFQITYVASVFALSSNVNSLGGKTGGGGVGVEGGGCCTGIWP